MFGDGSVLRFLQFIEKRERLRYRLGQLGTSGFYAP